MAAGGRRRGSGRKPGALNLAQRQAKDIASTVLRKVNHQQLWTELLASKDEKVRLDCLKYLTDRVHGKPAQSMAIIGDKDKPLQVIIRVLGPA